MTMNAGTHPFAHWRALLHALELVDAGEHRDPDCGICPQVSILAPKARPLLDKMIAAWPSHSGDAGFPIQGCPASPTLTLDPFSAYQQAWIAGQLWDINTKYGRNRFQLLRWLITRLRKLPQTREEAQGALYRLREVREAVLSKKSTQTVRFEPDKGLCALYFSVLRPSEQTGAWDPLPAPGVGVMALPWPEHSGNYAYPVPAYCLQETDLMTRRQDAELGYEQAGYYGKTWDASTPYGRHRLRLLDWLIEMLETSGDVWD